jgi:hypothetical protein
VPLIKSLSSEYRGIKDELKEIEREQSRGSMSARAGSTHVGWVERSSLPNRKNLVSVGWVEATTPNSYNGFVGFRSSTQPTIFLNRAVLSTNLTH